MLIVPSIAGAGGTGLASEAGGAPPPAWGDALSPVFALGPPAWLCVLVPFGSRGRSRSEAICELG